MCGIAGWLGGGNAAADVMDRMLRALAHRGPDDQGFWLDSAAGLVLGHTRLSIIDLSAAGHQPMTFGAGRYHITFNGEIYNYQELRNELEADGDVFATHTDTEVILAGWARWGEGVLPRLRGMFAFALWDRQDKTLFLVRDRFGIKPLYYAFAESGLLFASEIKALLSSGLISRQMDRQAVWDYLSVGSVPPPQTILKQVKMVPAGHYATVSCRAGAVPTAGDWQMHRYWDLHASTAKQRDELVDIPYPEAQAMIRRLLEEATKYHLIADVPVGAFLSGGIDSTLVVGLMSRLVRHPIKTYSIGFNQPHTALNELRWARLAARHFGCDHHEYILDGREVADQFDALLTAWDQPSMDGINTFFVSKVARRDVIVALSGLGGDELFAGYPQYLRLSRADRLAPQGWPLLAGLLKLWPGRLPGRVSRLMELYSTPARQRFLLVRRLATEAMKYSLTKKEWRAGFQARLLDDFYKGMSVPDEEDIIRNITYHECRGYLNYVLLRDCDAMSSFHALEVRPVLLDHNLAECAYSLPGSCKLKGAVTKRVLIDACRDLLPPEIISREKMGFELPLSYWLRHELRVRALDVFAGPGAAGLLDDGARDRITAALAGGQSCDWPLWPLFVLLAFIEKNNLDF